MPLAGTEAAVDLLTVDWDGEPLGNQDVEVVFYQREWERKRNSDFGIYFTEWEAIDTEVERATVTTDAQGKAQASFVPEEGGTYLAIATLTDSAGRNKPAPRPFGSLIRILPAGAPIPSMRTYGPGAR